jgi:hypothetical protein
MKVCFKCCERKPLSEFYRHPIMGDGHLNKCKECTKNDVNTHRAKHVEQARRYDRDRFHNDPNRRNMHKQSSYKYTREHPERRSARNKARRALLTGKIQKMPCETCGKEESQMHHPDYSRPLDIMWLCKLCHEEWHKKHGDSE